MGVALALDATAFTILNRYGHCQRSVTLPVRIARMRKADAPIPHLETIVGMLDITKAVVQAVTDYQVRHVGIQGYAHDAKWQVHQLGELAGVIKTQLWLLHKIVPEIVAPSNARKHVSEKGDRVTLAEAKGIIEGMGMRPKNDHEVYASLVARYMFDCVVVKEKESIYAE